MEKPARKKRHLYEWLFKVRVGYVREDGKEVTLHNSVRSTRKNDRLRAVAKAVAEIAPLWNPRMDPGGITFVKVLPPRRVRVPKSDIPF